jgi:putative addiction module component (TIGR02574 family)
MTTGSGDFTMPIDIAQLLSLPAAEKLRIIELLQESLDFADEAVVLPQWIETEASRRRDEMRMNPAAAVTHEEMWRRIDRRHG